MSRAYDILLGHTCCRRAGACYGSKFLLQILDAIVVTLVLAVHVYCVYCMKILSKCVAGSFTGRR